MMNVCGELEDEYSEEVLELYLKSSEEMQSEVCGRMYGYCTLPLEYVVTADMHTLDTLDVPPRSAQAKADADSANDAASPAGTKDEL